MSVTVFSFLILFLLWSALSTFASHKTFKNRFFVLFRALFPSWRFFDDIDRTLILWVRYKIENDMFSDWLKCLPIPRRTLGQILLNPQGNALLASQTLLQQLMSDVEDLSGDSDKVKSSVSFRLVRNLVRFHVNPARPYQFKLTLEPTAKGQHAEDAIISPIYED